MKQGLDVKHINPFLQSAISIFQSAVQTQLAVGRASVSKLDFPDYNFLLQVGVTGDLKGQILLVMDTENAKMIASRMMFGMPVNELDEMASSALSELSNMIMGNTATLFSAQNIHIDITPPLAMEGSQLHITADAQALKVPLLDGTNECMSLYICVAQE